MTKLVMFQPTSIVAALCLFGMAIEARSQTKCIKKAADIMFVLDSSTSIWIRHYREQLRFVAGLVKSFGVGKGNSHIRVGVITFSNQSHLEFPLDRYNKPVQLKKAILSIPHRRGETNTADALNLLKEQVEPNLKNNEGPTIAIVITDGYSMDPDATKEEARKLHALGITVYAIGVGNSTMYDMNELKAIASDPETGVYTVSSYSQLKKIRRTFKVRVCKEGNTKRKPTTTNPTTTASTSATSKKPMTIEQTSKKEPQGNTKRKPTTTNPTTTASTSATSKKPMTIEQISEKEPQNTEPKYAQTNESSIIMFGYDLVTMGAYRSGMINQVINTLLPYTGYRDYGIVSYGYCPSGFNVPITSLMDKDLSTIEKSVGADTKLPDLVDVVRKMRKVLYNRSTQHPNSGRIEKQVAVLFVDPSVTTITPELIKEIEMLKENGVKLYLVNVGTSPWPQPDQLQSIGSLPHNKFMFSAPSYQELLLKVQDDPFHFEQIYHQNVPDIVKHEIF